MAKKKKIETIGEIKEPKKVKTPKIAKEKKENRAERRRKEKKGTQHEKALLRELIKHYDESDKGLEAIRDTGFTWDEREEMLSSILTDSGSKQTKSKVNTGDLVNLVFDGASRVMAQFPTGTIQALNTKEDKGKNAMMSIIHDKYIVPNADAQHDLLTKFRMWDIYSRVFGSMPALVDYRIDNDYIGPDLWLIHPRSFFPQAGMHSINDMQYCQVSTWVSVEYLESRSKETWKNIQELVKSVKAGSKKKEDQDSKKTTVNERQQLNTDVPTGDYAQCELLTEYRLGRWITYSRDYNVIVRDIDNPQGNNELPIVMKECFPLLDRLYGLAEFERGHTLQKAADSLVNLYFDGVQMSIFPPIMVEQNGVVASSIQYKAKAKWLITKRNAISQMDINPRGINSFSSTYSFLKSQMLNLGATTDTSVSKDVDPQGGKTPEALKRQGAREGARDNWDRFMMEKAVEKVYQKFIDLLTTRQEKSIDIDLFRDDIKRLKELYPNEKLEEVFGTGFELFESGSAGKITIGAKEWHKAKKEGDAGEPGITKFKYIVDPGSTAKSDDAEEHDSLTDIIKLILEIPGAVEQVAQSGKVNLGNKTFDFGESMKRYIITSGVQDGEKIIYENEEQEGGEEGQGAEDEKAQHAQAMAQMQEQMAGIIEQMQKLTEKTTQKTIDYKTAPDSIKRQLEAEAGLEPDQGNDEAIKDKISYKDAPESVKRQMEKKAGLDPAIGAGIIDDVDLTGKLPPNDEQPEDVEGIDIESATNQINEIMGQGQPPIEDVEGLDLEGADDAINQIMQNNG